MDHGIDANVTFLTVLKPFPIYFFAFTVPVEDDYKGMNIVVGLFLSSIGDVFLEVFFYKNIFFIIIILYLARKSISCIFFTWCCIFSFSTYFIH